MCGGVLCRVVCGSGVVWMRWPCAVQGGGNFKGACEVVYYMVFYNSAVNKCLFFLSVFNTFCIISF